jgi:hypothetical protein
VQRKKVQKQDKNWRWVVGTLLPFLEYAYGDHAITWPRLVDIARTAETRRSDHFKPWFEALGRLDKVTQERLSTRDALAAGFAGLDKGIPALYFVQQQKRPEGTQDLAWVQAQNDAGVLRIGLVKVVLVTVVQDAGAKVSVFDLVNPAVDCTAPVDVVRSLWASGFLYFKPQYKGDIGTGPTLKVKMCATAAVFNLQEMQRKRDGFRKYEQTEGKPHLHESIKNAIMRMEEIDKRNRQDGLQGDTVCMSGQGLSGTQSAFLNRDRVLALALGPEIYKLRFPNVPLLVDTKYSLETGLRKACTYMVS